MKSTRDISERLSLVKQDLEACSVLLQEAEELLPNYDRIEDVTYIYENTRQIARLHRCFFQYSTHFQRMEELLKDSQNNLLLLVFYFEKLQEFREECRGSGSLEPIKNTLLEEHFSQLEDFQTRLTACLLEHLDKQFQYAKQGKGFIVVWLVRIALNDGHLDSLLTRVDKMLERQFKKAKTETLQEKLEILKQLQGNLLLVRDVLSKCFPDPANAYHFYLVSFHKYTAAALKGLVPKNLPVFDLLHLLIWAREYYIVLEIEHKFSRARLSPEVLHGKEEEIANRYITLCGEKIDSWLQTLVENELERFAERTTLPETDEKGHYVSPASVDLPQILKQHLSAIAPLQAPRYRTAIVERCVFSLARFQKVLLAGLQAEAEKNLSQEANDETSASYFEECLLMFGNTALRWIEYLAILSDQGTDKEKQLLSDCSQMFLEIPEAIHEHLVQRILQTLSPAVRHLFTKEWVSKGNANVFTATLADYLEDYKQHYSGFLFSYLVEEVFLTVISTFFNALAQNTFLVENSSLFTKQFFKEEHHLVFFFQEYLKEKSILEDCKAAFELIEKLLLSSTAKMLQGNLKKYAEQGGSLPFAEAFFLKRSDLAKVNIPKLIKKVQDEFPKKLQKTKNQFLLRFS